MPFGKQEERVRRHDEMVVTLTQDDHPALASSLAAHLKKMRADHIEMLAANPAKDFNDYQKRIGVIEGLAIAIAAADERNKALNA